MNIVHWLFGRGVSIACGLTWSVPDEWKAFPRENKIQKIKSKIIEEMASSKISISPYNLLLLKISQSTNKNWKHLFITTNWDYLLQQQIQLLSYERLPSWLANSHVFHINGTAEKLNDDSRRSPFLLEDDLMDQRTQTIEGNKAFASMICGKIFIIVGMSFECDTDKFLLTSLSKVQGDMPIGKSKWLIVNPNEEVLLKTKDNIQSVLPRCDILYENSTFEKWLSTDMSFLKGEGVFI